MTCPGSGKQIIKEYVVPGTLAVVCPDCHQVVVTGDPKKKRYATTTVYTFTLPVHEIYSL